MKYALVILSILSFSCQPKESTLTADEILNKAIEYSGKQKLEKNTLEFAFREYKYRATPTCEGFRFERMSKSEPIRDVLFKGELSRYVKDSIVKLADTTAFAYYESVNSVHYFMQLPLRLKDEAVRLEKLEEEKIDEQDYYKLRVTFSENGGGVDYEDTYIYWFDVEDFSMDYLAYSFLVNGGGVRFRKAINRREIDGVVFQDYENYKPKKNSKNVDSLGLMFNKDQLELLSLIENNEIALKSKTLNCN